jgi:hypothetical protein
MKQAVAAPDNIVLREKVEMVLTVTLRIIDWFDNFVRDANKMKKKLSDVRRYMAKFGNINRSCKRG